MRAFVVVAALATSAHADSWSETHRFTASDTSAVTILEPIGYTVAIGARTARIPAMVPVPEVDGTVVVTVTSPRRRSGFFQSRRTSQSRWRVNSGSWPRRPSARGWKPNHG